MQNIVFRKAGAKVLLFFDMTKYFGKKMQKESCFFIYWSKKAPKVSQKDYKDSAKRSASAIWSILPTSISR